MRSLNSIKCCFIYTRSTKVVDFFSQPKQFTQLHHRILRVLDTMADRPRILKDLVVVATLERLVAEEMHSRVVNAAGQVFLVLDVLQTVPLIPAHGEDVEGDLAADGVSAITLAATSPIVKAYGEDVRQPKIRKLPLNRLHKIRSYIMLQIKLLILNPLLHRRVPAQRAHIDHPVPELHESAPLHRDIEIRNVVQEEFYQLLVVVFAEPLDEAVARERLAHAVGGEAVFREAEVEEGGDGDGGGAELFLLLVVVGAADEADGDFVAELGEEEEHFGGDILEGGLGGVVVVGGRSEILVLLG